MVFLFCSGTRGMRYAFFVFALTCALLSAPIAKGQPSVAVISHNITSQCPTSNATTMVTIKVTGGTPKEDVATHQQYYHYTVTANNISTPPKESEEISVNTEKAIPIKRGESTLWVFDKIGAHSFHLEDILRDQFHVTIPVFVNLDPKNVQISHVLCPGETSGIIAAKEAGKDIRYILIATKAGSDPMQQDPADVVKVVNGTGIFEQLAAGYYKVWVENIDQCIFKYNQLFEVQDAPAWHADFEHIGEAKAVCPGIKLDQVKANITGGSGNYLRFGWTQLDEKGTPLDTIITKQNTLDSVEPGEWRISVVDDKGCRATFTHTMPGSRKYFIMRPPTEIVDAACPRYNENGDISKGTLKNLTLGGGNGTPKNCTWFKVPEPVKELEGQIVQLGSAVPYELPHGTYTIRILEGGCDTKFSFDMSYDKVGQPTLELRDIPHAVCYGDSLIFSLRISSPDALKGTPKYDFLVYHNLDGNKEVRGRVLEHNPAEYKYRLESHLYNRTSITVYGKSTKGCQISDSKMIQVVSPVAITYDQNVSHAGVLFNGKIIDKVRSTNIGEPNEVLQYYDSLALGVLEGTKTEVGFLLTGAKDEKITLEITPHTVFTPAHSGKPFLYELQLSPTDFADANNHVVSVSKDGYTYDFIHARAQVSILRDDLNRVCYTNKDIYIRLIDKLRIPNVFTPNDDGINDRWLYNGDPNNVNLYSHLQDLLPNLEVEVFTRAGISVWYARGDGIGQGWDGKTKGGNELLPIGTYYFVIRFNAPGGGSKWKPISGTVTIVR